MGILKGAKAALGGVDKKLIKTGLLARGQIVTCEPTGMTAGNPKAPDGPQRVCKVTVEVIGLPGHEPYEATCRHPIPIIYLTQMQSPGAAVAVRVDPDDPQNIALDLATDVPPADGASGPSAALPTTGDVEITTHQGEMTGAQVLADGADCRAIVIQTMPLGQKDSQGLDAVGFVLSVTIVGQAPFQAQVAFGIPAEAGALVHPGADLPAKAIPGRTDLVMIDWARALEEAKTAS